MNHYLNNRFHQWKWAHYSPDGQTLALNEASPSNTTSFIPAFSDQSVSAGWFFSQETNQTIPALKLSALTDSYLINESNTLPILTAKPRLDHQILMSISRLLPHDLNGKLMGISGIQASWEQVFPDEKSALEDMSIIRESLQNLANEATLLSWFFKDQTEQVRTLATKEIIEIMSSFLRRLFRPPNSLTLTTDHPNQSVLTSPSKIAYIISYICYVLSIIKEPSDDVQISLFVKEHNEEQALDVEIKSVSISNYLLNISTNKPSEINPFLIDWFLFSSALNSSIVSVENHTILINIPLAEENHQEKALVYREGSVPSNNAEIIIDSSADTPLLLTALVSNLYDISHVVLDFSGDAKEQAITAALQSLNQPSMITLQKK